MVLAKLVQSLKDRLAPAAVIAQVGSILPVRHRYILTRRNRVRLRYVASPLAVTTFLIAASFHPFAPRHGGAPVIYDVASIALIAPAAGTPAASAATAAAKEDGIFMGRYAAMARRMERSAGYDRAAAAVPEGVVPQAPRHKTVEIGKGDTLAGVLQKAGVSDSETYTAVQEMKKHYDPRSLRPGQKVALDFDPADDKASGYNFSGLRMDLDPLRTVSLVRTADDGFASTLHEKEAVRKLAARKTEIEVSLYGSALKAGIPAAVVADAIRVYSWDIDFQRDIRRGDTVEVMYEQFQTPDGTPVRSGEMVYARLNINGRDMPIYRYKNKDGTVDYYTADGTSIRKALLSTPVDGARLSSGFGVRKHPVLGYTKMHKGVDFAAARGTPIYAAGDGTIVRAGPFSSFGNYVRIRHNSSVDTAYAHMQDFAKGIRAGAHVKQGQVIGYIGTTGRSTGPHLHYEVLLSGEQVNPRSVKLPQGEILKGQQLQAFKAHVRDLDRQYAVLMGGRYAAAGQGSGVNRLR